VKQCPKCGASALESQSSCACGYEFPPLLTDPTRARPPFTLFGLLVTFILPVVGYQVLAATTQSHPLRFAAGFAIFALWFFLLSVPLWRAASRHPLLALLALALCLVGVASLVFGVLGSACTMGKPAP
jgi:hypothetical protein